MTGVLPLPVLSRRQQRFPSLPCLVRAQKGCVVLLQSFTFPLRRTWIILSLWSNTRSSSAREHSLTRTKKARRPCLTLISAARLGRVHELLPQSDSERRDSQTSQKLVPQPLPRQSAAPKPDAPHVRWKHPDDFCTRLPQSTQTHHENDKSTSNPNRSSIHHSISEGTRARMEATVTRRCWVRWVVKAAEDHCLRISHNLRIRRDDE